MFNELRLTDFKSFPQAELRFGPITTIIGANATGKSNLRDALKFLNAVGRGMTLPEIFGGKSSVGWTGIRGGGPGTVRSGTGRFTLELWPGRYLKYQISIAVGPKGPLVAEERLYHDEEMLFETVPTDEENAKILDVRLIAGGDYRKGQRTRMWPPPWEGNGPRVLSDEQIDLIACQLDERCRDVTA